MVKRASVLAAAFVLAGPACKPDIDTDPVPAVMEFDPNAKPPRVSEPSFLARDPVTGKIDLGAAGIEVPADCTTQPAQSRAQCEFNQYLESLDGFPTVVTARTPASGPVDLPTATVPANVAVIDGVSKQPITQVAVSNDATARYLVISPTRSWPVGAFIWMGVRGYDTGIHIQGKQVVASTVYNLLKRGDSLTCGAATAAAIPDTCPYLELLAQQMSVEMARASLVQLEGLRTILTFPQLGGGGWASLEQAGIPKAQAVVLWGFPVHSSPVIDLYPPAGLVPQQAGANEIRLAVNGTLDPATVTPLRVAQSPGTVMLVDLDALADPTSTAGFPTFSASYAAGTISIAATNPLRPGKRYAILITKGVKDPQGRALVPPPISVLLMARGPVLDPATMKSTVSSIGDAEAMQLEVGRQGLAMLLDDATFQTLTAIRREDLAYLYAFTWGDAMNRKLKPTRAMKWLAGSCLAMLFVAASAGSARAAGYLIYDLSGEALGKASAVVASTREPAAVWFNPAALTEMGHGVSLGGVGVFARSRFEPEAGGEEIKTEPGRFFLPTVFATAKVTDQVAVGFGAFPAFGLAIEWPEDWLGREAAIKAMVQTFTLNPTVAVRLLPGLSLGVGFQAVRSSVEFINGLPAAVGGTARLGGGTWGYGGNVALLYQPQMLEQLAFGLTYRSRVKLEFTGRVDFDPGRDFEPTLPDQGGTAELTLPDILSFGSAWRVAPAVTLTFDANYVLWSTYDELVVDFDQAPDLIQTRNNKNAFTLRLGVDWSTPVQGLSVRGGFILDQNPSPSENLAPSLPDANRLDFGAGVGYRWNWARADLGYLLVYFLPSDATGGEEGPVGTYKSLAQLLGLTLTAMFD